MAYVIAEPCIEVKDKGCLAVCPVNCIYEGPDMLYINPDECVSCDLCVAECPVNAIFNEDDIPEKWKQFIDINKNFFKPKPAGEQQPAQ